MKNIKSILLLAMVILALDGHWIWAQDKVNRGAEPVFSSIDPAKLTCDYLVDGDLPQDDPAARKFKTLQAAYAAAPAGTEAKPTVIGIKPNVYQLTGPSTRGASLSIRKNYITFLGLTNNRRAVVLADNRGLRQGAEDNGYIIDVDAIGFTAKNLTIINYCNADYQYPGDPGKNLTKRSDVITQGVALQAVGDKHIYENVALLGRLDTMFLRTTRSYFKDVYIEGTDDWMGGGQISVWENCTLVYPTGSGVMSASGIVFLNCRFEATGGMRFYKAEFRGAERPNVLINCVVPVNSTEARVAWVRGVAAPRPSQLSLTYHTKDANGKPAVICDSSLGPPAFTYSRELSERELPAFNPWNLLRAAPNAAADDWDPADVRVKHEATGQGSLPFRIALRAGSQSIRTGGPGANISATVVPVRADQTITWSAKSDFVSLSQTTGSTVVVTGRNPTSRAEWIAVTAAASNGVYVTAYVYVEPRYVDPPAITAGPKVNPPSNGMVTLDYALDLGGREDQSIVSWYVCEEPDGKNARKIAVSRGNQPLKALPLTSGYVGKYLKVTVQPKHSLCDPGSEVQTVSAKPVTDTDVGSSLVSPNFKNFAPETNDTYVSGLWTVLGNWNVVAGDGFVNGYGIRPSTAASLLYQQDADCGDMQVNLVMASEKAGQGFAVPGSPADTGEHNLHADMYIKYDPRTKNGYALRFWRTTQSAEKCMFQLYKIENGAGSPLNDRQVLSGVFKTTTRMTLRVSGKTLTVDASNDVDGETLALEGTITPNHFGGAGLYWPGGNSSTIYSLIEISYPSAVPAR
jgi:hypothetical protein